MHNLATINGKTAMAYQGETPWHKLGTVLEAGTVNIAEGMAAAQIDQVVVRLERMTTPRGTVVPNRFAVVSDHNQPDETILGTVSDWYSPIQYTEAFNLFQPAVEEFGLTVEAAGVLGDGGQAWMLFKLPVVMTPVKGDVVNGYGLAHTGHNGKTVYQFRPTGIRAVCQNTLDMALGANEMKGRIFSIAHIGNVKTELDQAREVVTNCIDAMKKSGDTFADMARKELTPSEVIDYIEGVLPADKDGTVSKQLTARRETVANLMIDGVGAKLARSSTKGRPNVWAAYNAFTAYFDHVVPAMGKKDSRVRTLNQSSVFGSGADIKLLALKLAQERVYA